MTTNRNDITMANDDAFAAMATEQLAGVVGGLHGSFSSDRTSYTVGRGDNLWNIARSQGESLGQLLAANPQFSQGNRNPNLIYPGEQISLGGQQPQQPSTGTQYPQNTVMQALQGLGV